MPEIDLFTFDLDTLLPLARRSRKQYRANKPFPHIIIDNFLPLPVANKLLDCFPGVDSPIFVNRNFKNQPGKFGTSVGANIAQTPAFIQHMLAMLLSCNMLIFLNELTGINGLLTDPYFYGGGLHQIVNGGKLNVHADFNFEENIKLYRRINLLLYLNTSWEERYGGYLELWDKEMRTRVYTIAPLFNRCVIFNTSRYSYHGHPVPLNVPPGVTRKSIAVYYYTKDPDPAHEAIHETLWQQLPH